MNKFTIISVFSLLLVLPSYAQDIEPLYASKEDSLQTELRRRDEQLKSIELARRNNEIWGKGRYTNISYSIGQTALENSSVDKSVFGFSLTKGCTFLFPRTPWGNMVKVGFDINWWDISVHKYNSSETWEYTTASTDDDEEDFNIGRMSLMVGALGIGPNVTVAPFAAINNPARFLKASLYFHYQPTLGAYLVSENGEAEASYAYCNMFQFGGKITWRFIGIGIEGHWGNGRFEQLQFETDDEYGDYFGDSSSSRITHRFANTRIYLSFRF